MKSMSRILSEAVGELMEGLTDVVYHYTDISALDGILSTDELKCTVVQGKADSYSRRHLFYISMSRSRNAKVSYYGSRKDVRLTLDGRKLSQRFSASPVNYWGGSKGDINSGFEYEDRLFTDRPSIPDAHSYIMRIDVYVPDGLDRTHSRMRHAAGRMGIPIYFYSDRRAFSGQTGAVIPDEEVSSADKDRVRMEPGTYRRIPMLSLLSPIIYFHFLDSVEKTTDIGGLVGPLLKRFGLGKYTKGVVDRIAKEGPFGRYMDKRDIRSWAYDLTGNSDFRKLNTKGSEGMNNGEGEKVMMLAAYVMKSNGVSNMDELVRKKMSSPSTPTRSSVRCVAVSYGRGERYLDGEDRKLSDVLNVEAARSDIMQKVWSGELPHKSSDDNQFERYIYRNLRPDMSLSDGADFLNRVFTDGDAMLDTLGVWLKTVEVDGDFFKSAMSKFGLDDIESVRKKLYG